MDTYTRIRLRHLWQWGPFIFLRYLLLGIALGYAQWRFVVWWFRRW
jgi:hypothetical protein